MIDARRRTWHYEPEPAVYPSSVNNYRQNKVYLVPIDFQTVKPVSFYPISNQLFSKTTRLSKKEKKNLRRFIYSLLHSEYK